MFVAVEDAGGVRLLIAPVGVLQELLIFGKLVAIWDMVCELPPCQANTPTPGSACVKPSSGICYVPGSDRDLDPGLRKLHTPWPIKLWTDFYSADPCFPSLAL